MFEELYDENDLECTEHRLRVHVLTLKKTGNVDALFRLYGTLAHVLARRGDHLKAQDALNDAEFLVVEHKWRGTQNEVWCHFDRARTFQAFGRPDIALRNLDRATELLQPEWDKELEAAILTVREELGSDPK